MNEQTKKQDDPMRRAMLQVLAQIIRLYPKEAKEIFAKIFGADVVKS